MRPFFIFLAALFLFPAAAHAAAPSDEAERLYGAYGGALYQVQVIDLASSRKTSIGSGFQFTADGLIATNYHVVAEAIQRPGSNRVEYLHDGGTTGALRVLAADVVHDLAILKMEKPGTAHLDLGTSQLPKGAKLYSLGNPHDLGFTIVEGTYNGLSRETFADKIHFSGSINPGMSGGPAIGHDGRVAGINVATAGNQISFLVPVEPLRQLAVKTARRSAKGFTSGNIERQLLERDRSVMGPLLQKKWESVPFGPFLVPGRIHPALKCWGGAEHKEKDPYRQFFSMCASEERLFLDADFDTGTILYRFDHITGGANLLLPRFYSLYEQQFAYPEGDYKNVKEENATNFSCTSHFTDIAQHRWKTNICARQYKKYPRIFDMHATLALLDAGREGFTATLFVQGVSRENASALLEKFMTSIAARPTADERKKKKGAS